MKWRLQKFGATGKIKSVMKHKGVSNVNLNDIIDCISSNPAKRAIHWNSFFLFKHQHHGKSRN